MHYVAGLELLAPLVRSWIPQALTMPLGVPRPDSELTQHLLRMRPAELLVQNCKDLKAAECCLAGLWLLAGDLERSHALSQEISSPEGSYWHGIMHRREGDFWNAKYWFHKAGTHPIQLPLAHWAEHNLASEPPETALPAPWRSKLLLGQTWQPAALTEACEQATQSPGAPPEWIVRCQAEEWQALLGYCAALATGQPM